MGNFFITLFFFVLGAARGSVVYKAENTVISDCGVGLDGVTMKFEQGYMRPDPVLWPGNATVGGRFVVLQDLPAKNLKLRLVVKKSSPFGFITVPCIKPLFFGSCDFDVCEYVLTKYKEKLCDIAGICSCPVKKGVYLAKDFVQPLPSNPLIGLVIEGEYEGESKFFDANDETKVYGCLNVKFSIVKRDEFAPGKSLK